MMADDFQDFPAFLYPRNSTRWKGHTVVDYGVTDSVDINIIDDSDVSISSRKSFENNHVNYEIGSFCLPTGNPNNRSRFPLFEDISDVSIIPHDHFSMRIGKILETPSKAQVNRLFIDHPDILIGSTMNEMNDSEKMLLRRCFHPVVYSYDVPFNYERFLKQPAGCNYKQFFKYGFHATKTSMGRFRIKKISQDKSYLKNFDRLLGEIHEIPKDILLDYLDEELTMQYDVLTKNHHLGNCLAYSDNLIMYPKDNLDILSISPLEFQSFDYDDDAYSGDEFHIKTNSTKTEMFQSNGIIRELICTNYDNGNSILAIRNDLCCMFLSKKVQDSPHEMENQYFSVTDSVKVKSQVLSLAVNPYFTNDAIITLENGMFKHWTDGQSVLLNSAVINDSCTCNQLHWMNCVYATNPMSFFIIHSEEVQQYDIRVPQKPCQLMLQLPNSYVNRMDKLTRPACLHPANPHQLILTSEQGLIVLDERFKNSPLMTINHHMRSGPQFMQTIIDQEDAFVHTLALLGGHRYRDTRILEFEQERSAQIVPNWLVEKPRGISFKTPCSVRKPRMLGRPESWLQHFTNDVRTLSPGVEKRLAQPLIGLVVMALESSGNYAAIQLTKCGDLFHQLLRNRPYFEDEKDVASCDGIKSRDFSKLSTSHKKESSNETKGVNLEKSNTSTRMLNSLIDLPKKAKTTCQEWIDIAYKTYVEKSDLHETSKIFSVCAYTDEGNITKAYDLQQKNHERFCKESIKYFEKTNEKGSVPCSDSDIWQGEKLSKGKNSPLLPSNACGDVAFEESTLPGQTVYQTFEKDNREILQKINIEGITDTNLGYESLTRSGNVYKKVEKKVDVSLEKHKKVLMSLEKDCSAAENSDELLTIKDLVTCSICSYPNADDGRCSCCGIEIDGLNALKRVKDNGLLLTNNALSRNCNIDTVIKCMKNPEMSRDPLSTVLYSNWQNDEFYTPIDLTKKKSKVGEKRKMKLEDFDDIDGLDLGKDVIGSETDNLKDNWFLDNSGNLEFKNRDEDHSTYRPVRKKVLFEDVYTQKEELVQGHDLVQGRMTSSKLQQLSSVNKSGDGLEPNANRRNLVKDAGSVSNKMKSFTGKMSDAAGNLTKNKDNKLVDETEKPQDINFKLTGIVSEKILKRTEIPKKLSEDCEDSKLEKSDGKLVGLTTNTNLYSKAAFSHEQKSTSNVDYSIFAATAEDQCLETKIEKEAKNVLSSQEDKTKNQTTPKKKKVARIMGF